MEEILNKDEVIDWLHLDDDLDDSGSTIDYLMQSAYDVAEGAIDEFADKVKSAKFRRKLKLLMLNYIASAYDKRGLKDNTGGEMQFINATLLRQLQYGTYSENDA